MEKLTTVNHQKGQKHSGKTNWSKVVNTHAPSADEENPELAKNPKNKFYKPEKKNT